MDLLSQIWTAWNQEWGVTVATILSIIAIAMNAGEKFHKMWSAVRHWKVWPALCTYVQVRTKGIPVASGKACFAGKA